jgi:hypothetical protein
LNEFLLALLVAAAGAGILRAAGLQTANLALQLGLAVAVGLAGGTLLLYAPLALRLRVDFLALRLGLGLAAGWLAWCWLRRGGPFERRATLSWAGFLLAGLALAAVAHARAFEAYDERAIYGLKAKALLNEGGVQGSVFQDLDVVHYHRDYPLGVPLWMAWCGHESRAREASATPMLAEDWVQTYGTIETYAPFAALWSVGLLALAFGWARATRSRWVALALPLSLPLTLIAPWIGGHSWSWSGADLPLALLVGAGALALVEWQRTGARRWFLCATFLLATGLLLKQDAWLVLGAAALAATVSGVRRPSPAGLAGAGLALALVWLLSARVSAAIPELPAEENYLPALSSTRLAIVAQRIPLLLSFLTRTLADQSTLAFWLAVVLLGIPLAWRAGAEHRLLGGWVALHLLATATVFLLSPNNIDWHISTAMPRLLAHVGVPAGFLCLSAIERVVADLRATFAGAPRGA